MSYRDTAFNVHWRHWSYRCNEMTRKQGKETYRLARTPSAAGAGLVEVAAAAAGGHRPLVALCRALADGGPPPRRRCAPARSMRGAPGRSPPVVCL